MIFYYRTNASPIYLVLFISATYFLNRPCVYCSLLLAILVLSLFDFRANWFEPRYATTSSNTLLDGISDSTVGTATNIAHNAVIETISAVASKINATTMDAIHSIVGDAAQRSQENETWTRAFGEWVRGVLRKEWRIECFDVVVRL